MKFIKAGEIADSNIFNKLDERKKSLLEGGMDVTICPSARRIFSRVGM